jgi:signal transduction histidine kinase
VVVISVKVEQQILQVFVQDNGVGFEFDSRYYRNVDQGNRRSFGLQGMQERMNALHGGVAIDTSIGNGCCVVLTMPLGGKADD